ncbi:Nucleoside diphosphate-linked moiety X motif 19 [Bagarius yarrelli]|uniref:Acyl-coenzyme A diphosphatase NUDT19 n=1 Tax=Bagarius yarrelli TaxID=175774 RepID=A0A556VVN6_BAGYA|nr:Nucleoside diphosphate-linked moiety X motif 19 [Bagarius yarrelli]
MNTALKHWKEAATVILAAGTRNKRSVEFLWKETPGQKTAFDYEVLLLKRSGKSGFMPNAYVFPGGLADPSDFSSEWLEVFKAFIHLPKFGIATVKQPLETRPPIFATDRQQFGSSIPGDVAFRICAVRETFEESGVLLVVPSEKANTVNSNDHGDNDNLDNCVPQPGLIALSDRWGKSLISKWRSLVLENSSNFIRMCKELDCLPNIWGLHEWGNWLTPTSMSVQQRRYDTAFYICFLKDIPETLQDRKEIEQYKWSSPPEILHSYQERKFWIAPPQLYDVGRMCNFPVLSDLHDFAKQRSVEGCERCLPVILKATDCSISLLPGDSLYPENTDRRLSTEKCLEELQRESPHLHRIVMHNLYQTSVYINITPKYQHLPPLITYKSKHYNKL